MTTLRDVTERRRAARFGECELAVTRILVTTGDMPGAEHAVLATIAENLGWCHAELWLADQVVDVLRPTAVWTSPDHHPPVHVPDTISRGFGMAGTVWQQDEPLWLADTRDGFTPIATTGQTAQFRAALGVPVRAGGRSIGALCLFAESFELPDGNLETLLAGIAAVVGEYLQRLRAEQLDRSLVRSKDDYIALVGHELRTPLTSIASYTALLRDTEDSAPFADVRPLAETIDRNTALLRGVVDDLLDLAALDSGHAAVLLEPTDVRPRIDRAVAAVMPAARDQHVTIDTRLPDRLVVDADPHRLQQMLDNLIGNAVKYSPDGGHVTISLTVTADIAELRVTDTGIGIPAEEHDRLFTRFYRSSRARDRAIPGTGLGLARTRLLAEHHHGTVTLADTSDTGTTTVLRLPLPDSSPSH